MRRASPLTDSIEQLIILYLLLLYYACIRFSSYGLWHVQSTLKGWIPPSYYPVCPYNQVFSDCTDITGQYQICMGGCRGRYGGQCGGQYEGRYDNTALRTAPGRTQYSKRRYGAVQGSRGQCAAERALNNHDSISRA